MHDDPQAEACAEEETPGAEATQMLEPLVEPTLYGQVSLVLPRLSAIAASVALLGPTIIEGPTSYGRGCGW